jgi:MinD superfamily P-loop ATPase
MSIRIAIASGKGGTGKTTVSVNLYYFIHQLWSKNIQLVDCDVEEPDDLVFFPEAVKNTENKVTQLISEIDINKCTFCRKCVEYCEFNAIVVIPPAKFAEVNASLCHSCGACSVACQDNAITERSVPIGKITHYFTGLGNGLLEGRLRIGSAMQTMVIRQLKKEPVNESEIIIYDAPPGTSCPVVITVANADYIILVTEPTPFGLHDLKLTIDILKTMDKPYGVIVNKAGMGNKEIYKFLEKENIELLGEIPYHKGYAKKYAAGELLNKIPDRFKNYYIEIIDKLKNKLS